MDNNDNAPVFSQPVYETTISEDTLPDTEVVQVLASDRDEHHQLSYSLQSSIDPSSMRLFHIHPNTGIIYTVQSLDHEACAQHILTVMVRYCFFFYNCQWAPPSWILNSRGQLPVGSSTRIVTWTVIRTQLHRSFTKAVLISISLGVLLTSVCQEVRM